MSPLPPLPQPESMGADHDGHSIEAYSADAMAAYGEACARDAYNRVILWLRECPDPQMRRAALDEPLLGAEPGRMQGTTGHAR